MPRLIEVIVLRHGDKDLHGNLSPEGKTQAAKAGKKLSRNSVGFITKVYTSPAQRAITTGEEIRKILKSNFKDKPQRIRKNFVGNITNATAFKDAVAKFGGEDKAVEAWLRNTFDQKVVEPVSDAHKRIETMLRFPIWLSNRLGNGPPVRLVYITHNWTMGAMVELFSGNKLSKLGGRIKFCEPITFKFSKNSAPSMSFRHRTFKSRLKPLLEKTLLKTPLRTYRPKNTKLRRR